MNERTRERVERVDRWGRWLLDETTRHEMLEPFIADHLAEVDASGDLPKSFERESVHLLIGAVGEDRRRRLRGASWPYLMMATVVAALAALLAGAAPMQKLSVAIGAALGVVLCSAGHGLLRVLGRATPAAFVVACVFLFTFGIEYEGRQAWLHLGPFIVMPGTLLLPMILLVPAGWGSRIVITFSALAVFLLGDWVAGAAMLLVWVPSPARGLALLAGLFFMPLAFGEPLPLVTTSGSATVALLLSSVLLRHRPVYGTTPA